MSRKSARTRELMYSDGTPSGKFQVVVEQRDGTERTAKCCMFDNKEHTSREDAIKCYHEYCKDKD